MKSYTDGLRQAYQMGIELGQLRERRHIIDWLAAHVPTAPGSEQWVDNLVRFIESRTEQPAVPGEEAAGSLPTGPASEPTGDRCGLWFVESGDRHQCFEPAGHHGAHASYDQIQAWREVRRQARWYPQSDGSALWERYLDGDR